MENNLYLTYAAQKQLWLTYAAQKSLWLTYATQKSLWLIKSALLKGLCKKCFSFSKSHKNSVTNLLKAMYYE